MRFNILNKKTWFLILFMGIFQILSITFDQVVIQKEDISRDLSIERLRLIDERSDLLRYNTMIVKGVKLASDISLFIEPSKMNLELKKSFYISTLLDIGILELNLLSDKLIVNILQKRQVKYQDYKGTEVVRTLYDVLLKNSNEIQKLKNSQLIDNQIIFNLIPWASEILEQTNTDVVIALKKNQENILKNSDNIFKNDNQRQSYLLFGVFFQLTSLFFLLIFFREIMKKKS
jgi:hypothetical protein